jgi:hypothetical protein
LQCDYFMFRATTYHPSFCRILKFLFHCWIRKLQPSGSLLALWRSSLCVSVCVKNTITWQGKLTAQVNQGLGKWSYGLFSSWVSRQKTMERLVLASITSNYISSAHDKKQCIFVWLSFKAPAEGNERSEFHHLDTRLRNG